MCCIMQQKSLEFSVANSIIVLIYSMAIGAFCCAPFDPMRVGTKEIALELVDRHCSEQKLDVCLMCTFAHAWFSSRSHKLRSLKRRILRAEAGKPLDPASRRVFNLRLRPIAPAATNPGSVSASVCSYRLSSMSVHADQSMCDQHYRTRALPYSSPNCSD